ncbi:hypothetical protein K443DRAFT_348290 [Laccaria amethystina LaAM-08-1]|uniref:Uncharacterized protein n=1 Tax=Laccaria amethystina LaAM-08-1 TaxID=1095629 RepID=A0A0C9WJK0_9AGAR|nr:hypothetical protein K443DRAFT_348290 [Laccaria amethystina LaAM-08-1]
MRLRHSTQLNSARSTGCQGNLDNCEDICSPSTTKGAPGCRPVTRGRGGASRRA